MSSERWDVSVPILHVYTDVACSVNIGLPTYIIIQKVVLSLSSRLHFPTLNIHVIIFRCFWYKESHAGAERRIVT